MPITVLFLAVIMAIAGGWLLQQRLTAKPWLEEGVIGDFDGTGSLSMPAAKIGLGVFLAVIGSLFALLISAYFMRRGYADWREIRVPHVLWANTATLVLTSVALQGAKYAVSRRHLNAVRARLTAGGVFGLAFVGGQLWAWQELTASGFLVATNPSDSFFYLITGLHGLHVLGGLAALGWTAERAWRGIAAEKIQLSVDICATYWHFMLIVWLVLFSLLTGLAEDFGTLCRQLLT